MIFRTVPTDPDHNQDAEDDLFYRDTLQELVQVGATLARLLQTQAIADAQATVQGLAPATPLADHAAAFDRIARAVRRTITLARSLNEPAAPARDPAQPRAAARTATLPETGQDAAAHAATPEREDSPKATEASSADLSDRRETPDRDRPDRDAPDRDEDDTGRPPATVIADIRRDLGLDTPPGAGTWAHGTPADTAQLHAPAAAPTGTAANGAHQPSPGPQESWPQGPWLNAAQHSPDPPPEEREPAQPAATPRVQPGPIHASESQPDDPAPAIATTLHHPIHIQERWRPPPAG